MKQATAVCRRKDGSSFRVDLPAGRYLIVPMPAAQFAEFGHGIQHREERFERHRDIDGTIFYEQVDARQ